MRIEPLGMGDVASAVELVRRVLRVDPGDRREQFASGIAGGTVAQLYAPAIGEVHVVRSARITLEHAKPRKRIKVVGYLTVEAEGAAPSQVMSGAEFPASTTQAPNCTAASCDRPTRHCAGRYEDGATPPSPLTSTTGPTADSASRTSLWHRSPRTSALQVIVLGPGVLVCSVSECV